ncbi:MAG: hypothetical protein R2770_10250 [Acidimicrobiales bacterium]
MTQFESIHGTEDPALRRIVLALRRALPLLLVFTSLSAAAGYLLVSGSTEMYSSESVIELTDQVAIGVTSTGQRRGDAVVEIEAQRRLIESSSFAESLASRLGAEAGDVAISVTNPEDSPVLVIGIEADEPELAERGADEFVDLYVEQRIQNEFDRLEDELVPLRSQREEQSALVDSLVDDLQDLRLTGNQDEISVLENRVASALDRLDDYNVAIQEREFFQQTIEGNVRVVEPASPAVKSSSSSVVRAVQFGLIALLLGIGATVLVSRIRGRVLLLDEVRAIAGPDVPVLATVPKFGRRFRKGRASLVVASRAARREAEAFRYVRSALEVAAGGVVPRSIVFTSARPNEGKTVTAANLALASARGGQDTALLDGDILNSSVERVFELKGMHSAFPSLIDEVVDPADHDWHTVGIADTKLSVLATQAYRQPGVRTELTYETALRVFNRLKKTWDIVVVDAPPVLAVSDALSLARAGDLTVLVVKLGATRRRDVETAVTQLRQGDVNLAGVVVTHVRQSDDAYYGGGYNYGGMV